MSATIQTQVKGLQAVTSNLRRREASAMSAIERAVKSSATNLAGYIMKEKLSGQVLKVRTGDLRRSFALPRFESRGAEIRAYVGTNVKYARLHEYGFNGAVAVKSHQRMMTKAFGRIVKNPRLITVRAHSMKMNVRARPFMAPSLKENKENIVTDIRKALVEAIK